MNKHKWYKEIQAWSEGAEIEEFSYGVWEERDQPKWHLNYQYRIKATVKEPKTGRCLICHSKVNLDEEMPQPEKKYLYMYNASNGNVQMRQEYIVSRNYLGKIEVQDD